MKKHIEELKEFFKLREKFMKSADIILNDIREREFIYGNLAYNGSTIDDRDFIDNLFSNIETYIEYQEENPIICEIISLKSKYNEHLDKDYLYDFIQEYNEDYSDIEYKNPNDLYWYIYWLSLADTRMLCD